MPVMLEGLVTTVSKTFPSLARTAVIIPGRDTESDPDFRAVEHHHFRSKIKLRLREHGAIRWVKLHTVLVPNTDTQMLVPSKGV